MLLLALLLLLVLLLLLLVLLMLLDLLLLLGLLLLLLLLLMTVLLLVMLRCRRGRLAVLMGRPVGGRGCQRRGQDCAIGRDRGLWLVSAGARAGVETRLLVYGAVSRPLWTLGFFGAGRVVPRTADIS